MGTIILHSLLTCPHSHAFTQPVFILHTEGYYCQLIVIIMWGIFSYSLKWKISV